MKYKAVKKVMRIGIAMAISAVLLSGCSQKEENPTGSVQQNTVDTESIGNSSNRGAELNTEMDLDSEMNSEPEEQTRSGVSELEVRFGDAGEAFMMHLEENETAAAIAQHVGSTDWRLPIYERDEDADYDVMQYYDISNRYEIPSAPENITTAKVGDVFYSDPNRIVLFYADAEISAEYTRIGSFDATEEFVNAVKENPVLEGWGNKIIQIARP